MWRMRELHCGVEKIKEGNWQLNQTGAILPTLYKHGLIILTPDLTADYMFMTFICYGLYLAAQSEFKNVKIWEK